MNYQTRVLTPTSVSFFGSLFSCHPLDYHQRTWAPINDQCFAQYLETSCAVKILNICVFYDVITSVQKLTTVL